MTRAIAATVFSCVLVSDLAHAQNNPAPPTPTPRFDVGVRCLNAIDRTGADRSTWTVPHDNSPAARVSLGVTFW